MVRAGTQEAGLFCGCFLEKGEAFAYGGSIQTLKDLIKGRRGLRFPYTSPKESHTGVAPRSERGRPRMGSPLLNSDRSSPQATRAYMTGVLPLGEVSGPLARFRFVAQDFVAA